MDIKELKDIALELMDALAAKKLGEVELELDNAKIKIKACLLYTSVNRLCSSMVAEMRIGVIQRGRKNPLPFSFFLRLRSLPQPPKVGYQGKRVFKEGRNRRCLPFLPSAAGAVVCQEQQFGAHIDIFVCICYHKAQ